MFEAQVAYYLNKYLGKYLYGLDAESLKISVWKGDVELRNLSLKPEALQDLDLPITVRAGLLGRLTVKVPWSKLGREPVIVELDRLYVLAGPSNDSGGRQPCKSIAEYQQQVEKSFLEAMRRRVLAAELDWLQELEAKAVQSEKSPSGSGSRGSSFVSLQSIIDPIIGNLQLRLTNVHVRYEDASSYTGHGIAVGVMFRKIGAHTVDEVGRRAFVTSNVLQYLRKAVNLARLCVYFDVDKPFVQPGKAWTDMGCEEWDALFLPELHDNESAGMPHEYLICPVSGSMKYTRRSSRFRRGEGDAKQEMALALEEVRLCYSRLQYASTQQLLEMLDAYQANAPYMHLRPHCRPVPGLNSRLWWHYAVRAVCQQLKSQRLTWADLQRVSLLRKKYVPQYVRCIQNKQLGGDALIIEMEKQLQEGTILLFRRMAHAKVESAKRQAAREAASSSRGWVSWMMGGARGDKPADAPERGELLDPDMKAELSPAEWRKLEDLLEEQEVKEDTSTDTPHTLRLLFSASVGEASLVLEGLDGGNVATAALGGVAMQLRRFPRTLGLVLSVGRAGVHSPLGVLFSTGALDNSQGAAAAALAPAFSLDFTKSPQDGSADAVVQLMIAPSYVTYIPDAVDQVLSFFNTDRSLELSSLQAQAAARVDQLQRLAQLQLCSLTLAEEKPKLLLSLCCHAPKVAVPDSTGRATLIMDLGLFNLKSSRDLAASLKPEEAALYECFTLDVKSVSAYLYDGAFAWPAAASHPTGAAAARQASSSETSTPLMSRGASASSGGSASAVAVFQLRVPGPSWDMSTMLLSQVSHQQRLVPLLDKFGINVGLQVSTSVHPRLPQLRLHANASPISIQVSPFRFHCLMTVVNSVLAAPAPTTALAGGPGPADAQQGRPLWMTDAEYRCKVLVLSWEGMTGTKARWNGRWLSVWRGRVFVSKDRDDCEVLDTRSYWHGYCLLELAPALIGGYDFCLAIVPQDVCKEDAAEHPDALVLRLKDATALTDLRRHLSRSKTMMSAVAGLLDQRDAAAGAQDEVGLTKDIFTELFKHKDIVEVNLHVPQVAVQVSGRPPRDWCPPCEPEKPPNPADGGPNGTQRQGSTPQIGELSDEGAGSEAEHDGDEEEFHEAQEEDEQEGEHCDDDVDTALQDQEQDAANSAGAVLLEDEVPLLLAKFQVAVVDMAYSNDRLQVTAAMRALDIDDLLMGADDVGQVAFARSSVMPGLQQKGSTAEDDGSEFVDASEAPASPSTPSSSHSSKGAFLAATTASAKDDEQLVAFTYCLWDKKSTRYTGLDNDIVMRLSSLYFYCHRPTVAAIMVLGSDLADIVTLLDREEAAAKAERSTSNPAASLRQPSMGGSSVAGDSAEGAESSGGSSGEVVLSGGERRTVVRMAVEMKKLEVSLCYEGACYAPLAVASMDNFSLQLDVHPVTLELLATLGNVVATYAALPASSAHRTICALRPGTYGSLIEVMFRIHSRQESYLNPRVPSGMQYYSLVARLSAVKLVMLRRFLNEFLDYITVLLAMQRRSHLLSSAKVAAPEALQPAASAPTATTTATLISSEELSSALVLLDVSLAAPVIAVPESSASNSSVELDLGFAQLSNTIQWQADKSSTGQRVLVDDIKISLTDMSAIVNSSVGKEQQQRGQNIIKDIGEGFKLQLSRPILLSQRNPGAVLPPMQVSVAIPEITAALLDTEYKLLLAIITHNLAEPLQLPAAIAILHQRFLHSSAAAAAAAMAAAQQQQRQQQQRQQEEAAASPPPTFARAASFMRVPSSAGRSMSMFSPRGSQPKVSVAKSAASTPGLPTGTPTKHMGRAAAYPAEPRTAPRHSTSSPSASKLAPAGPVPPERDFSKNLQSLLSFLEDTLEIKVMVHVGHAQLQLSLEQPDGQAAQPLTRLLLADLWVSYHGTKKGNLFVSLHLPTLAVEDLRPGLAPEQRLVLSTADVGQQGPAQQRGSKQPARQAQDGRCLTPSLLTMEFRSISSAANEVQAIKLRVQKPTAVLDFGFIMAVLNFVAPQPVLQGAVPQPFRSNEVYLTDVPHQAQADLWLSPEYRILADAPGVENFVFDGCGHRLVLPRGIPSTELLPLIMVGAGKTLTLRNVRVVNSSSLAACLSLAPGARLMAHEEDQVRLIPLSKLEDEYSRALIEGRSPMRKSTVMQWRELSDAGSIDSGSAASPAAAAAAAGAAGSAPGVTGAASERGAADATAKSLPLLELHLEAVGANLHLVDITHLSRPAGTAAASAISPAGTPSERQFDTFSRLMDQPGAAAGTYGCRILRRLALLMDLNTTIRMQGSSLAVDAQIQGLAMKTLTTVTNNSLLQGTGIASGLRAATSLRAAAAQGVLASMTPLPLHSEGSSSAVDVQEAAPAAGAAVEAANAAVSSILESCDIVIKYLLDDEQQDVKLDLSDVHLKLSPDVMSLVLQLQRSIVQPLIVPATDQPLARCSQFERLYSSGPTSSPLTFQAVGKGGVDSMAEHTGVTIWRPQPAHGYIILGDVLSAGHAKPNFQVATVAINSGLVIYPTGYTQVWAGEGGAVWLPNPPPGYVALGCVGHPGKEPPPLRLVGCLHKHCVVEARTGECMLLSDKGNLWVVQNSGCTFQVSPPQALKPQVPVYDLRSPLSMPPAALTPQASLTEAGRQLNSFGLNHRPPPPSLLAQKRYLEQRHNLILAVAMQRSVATAVEFQRMWWDKHTPGASTSGVSFWRPLPPPGYVSLGDCMVTGIYAPPQGALVLRDTDPGQLVEGRPGLLARPIGFVQVWFDEQRYRLGDARFLSVWRPVAPAGYVPVGLVVNRGSMPPKTDIVRCVRADTVFSITLPRGAPNLTIPGNRSRLGLFGWITDERTNTFTVQTEDDLNKAAIKAKGGEPPKTLEAWRIKLNDEADEKAPLRGIGQEVMYRSVNLEVSTGRVVLLLRNSMRLPVLELSAQDIKMGVCTQAVGVTRGFVFLTATVWSYNGLLCAWEPVVEPWQLLLHLDSNADNRQRAGVSPGTWLRLTSTQGSVQVSLAHAAISSILHSSGEWMALADGSADARHALLQRQLAVAEGACLQSLVHNTLGVPCNMLLDFGDHQDIVDLPAGEQKAVLQPLAQLPAMEAGAQGVHGHSRQEGRHKQQRGTTGMEGRTLPALRLLLDVLYCSGVDAELAGAELSCRVQVHGAAWEVSSEPCWGLATRAVPIEGPQMGAVWHERFIIKLPPALCEQLLLPAPGDNQFAGCPMQLEFWLDGGSGGADCSCTVGSAFVPVEFSWLAHQVQTMLLQTSTKASGGAAADVAGLLLEVPITLQTQQAAGAAQPGMQSARGAPADAAVDTAQNSDTRALLVARINFEQYQLEPSWQAALLGQRGAAASSKATVVGRRALQLAGSEAWVPFVNRGRELGAANLQGFGVVPIPAGPGVALESSITAGGTHQEVLRSLCQLVNATALPLEVRLVAENEDASWTLVPISSSSASQAKADVVEEEVFENERFVPLRGWSHTHLTASDRLRYNRSRAEGQGSVAFPQVPLAAGWEWEGSWEVETTGHVDSDGWAYGGSWGAVNYPFHAGCGQRRPTDLVRRRRWVRRRRKQKLRSAEASDAQVTFMALGVVAPGTRLPLPLGWDSDGCELQVRPMVAELLQADQEGAQQASGGVIADVEAASEDSHAAPLSIRTTAPQAETHAWSRGNTGNGESVMLKQLADGSTKLLCCRSLQETSGSSTPLGSAAGEGAAVAALAALQPYWLSVTTECDALVTAQGAGLHTLNDWRVTARPPLLLHNQLPVVAHFMVWERPRAASSLKLRHQGRMQPGEVVHVYTADMRQQVLLSFWPEGCEFAEMEPVIVSEGFSKNFSGVAANAPRLPDSFRVKYANSQATTQLRLYIRRDLELTAGDAGAGTVMESSGTGSQLDLLQPAEAVAQGCPLTVRLYVPLWIINATHLRISTGVVSLDIENLEDLGSGGLLNVIPEASAASVAARPMTGTVGMECELRLVDTDAFASTPKPPGFVTVAPQSVELLSYPLFSVEQQYGIVVALMDGRWSAPLVLPGSSAALKPGAAGMPPASTTSYEPVVIRARSRADGSIHEVVVRIESAGIASSRSLILRLDTHMTVTNRTGYDLQLIQPEGYAPTPARPSAGISPLAAGAAAVGSPQLLLQQQQLSAALTAPLSAGTTGLPLHWHQGCTRRMLCLTLPGCSRQADSHGGGGGWLLWSEPFKLEYPGGIETQVVLPVFCLGEVQAAGSQRADLEAAMCAARLMFHDMSAGNDLSEGAGTDAKGPDTAGPMFIRVAKHTNAGPMEFLAVVVHLSMHVRSPGCLHLVLHSIGGEPQHLLLNATPFPVRFREHFDRALWRTLDPFSAEGYARQYMLDASLAELEVQDAPQAPASQSTTSQVVMLDPGLEAGNATSSQHPQGSGAAAGSAAGGASSMAMLQLGPAKQECLAQLAEVQEVAMGPSGLRYVPGGQGASLGATQLDRVLRLVPRPPALSSQQGPRPPSVHVLSSDLALSGAGHSFHVVVEVGSLEVSLVDAAPQELLLVTIDGLSVEYHVGAAAGISYIQFHLRVRNAQMDDQLPCSPHPVLLLPLDANRSDHPATEPLLFATYVSEPGRRRGVLYCPCIAAQVQPLRVSLSEALLWRVVSMARSLASITPHMQRGAAATAGPAGSMHEQVSTDLPLQIDLLNIEDMQLRLSFKTDAMARPRFASQLLVVGLEFANLEDLPLVLPGIELEGVKKIQRSMLSQQVLERLQQRLLGIAFSVLCNYGVLGSTSKILAAVSAGVAQLTDSSAGASEREVGHIGDGVMEGGKAFARGLFKGALGIVSKPYEGAEKGGVSGFLQGVAKGIVGAAAAPVSGALAAASKVTEGIDASYVRAKEAVFSAPRRSGRKRLPRPFTGDRVLRPFSLHSALGQGLLHSATWYSAPNMALLVGGLQTRRVATRLDVKSDVYEEHCVLPGSKVLMATSRRLLLLDALDFVSLQSQVLSGEVTHVTDVPPGQVVWQLPWEGLLTAELAWHKQQAGLPADGILVHRKRRDEDDNLLYDVHCRAGTNQAQEVLQLVQACRYKFYVQPRQEAEGWRDQTLIPSKGTAGQERPDTLLSLEFKLVWYSSRSNTRSAEVVSIWRPIGPLGYSMLGDVVVPGTEPPTHPVRMYKDILNSDSDAVTEGPRLLPPTSYALVFRDSAYPPLTLWKPMPPKGYMEMGCVAWPDMEEPPLSLVRCIRRDLVATSHVYDSPLWFGVSSDNPYWRCSMWQVDNNANTFLATKSDQRPHPQLARTPVY